MRMTCLMTDGMQSKGIVVDLIEKNSGFEFELSWKTAGYGDVIPLTCRLAEHRGGVVTLVCNGYNLENTITTRDKPKSFELFDCRRLFNHRHLLINGSVVIKLPAFSFCSIVINLSSLPFTMSEIAGMVSVVFTKMPYWRSCVETPF